MSRRYAIYFAPPPGSSLEAFGRSWLGRDHISGAPVDQPAIEGLTPEDQVTFTRSARHYGFHATLKAPFELASGRRAGELHEAVHAFAQKRQAFDAPAFEVKMVSKWVALTLSAPCPEMDTLAADCVRGFEALRAPLTAADIERRRKSGLTARQDRQMLDFGYPHVFEDFKFHMTLAGPLQPAQQSHLHAALLKIAPLDGQPVLVDGVSVYEQASRDQPFIQTARFPFGAPRSS